MNMQSKYRTFAIAAVGLLLAGCNGAEITRISEEMKLSENEVAAFRICVRDTGGKKMPILDVGGKKMKMSYVPLEICGCMSPTIVKIFKQENIKYGFGGFVKYASKVEKGRVPRIAIENVADGVKRETGIKAIWDTFETCAADYRSKFKQESAEVFVPWVPKKTKEQKAKEKAEAAAKQANAAE